MAAATVAPGKDPAGAGMDGAPESLLVLACAIAAVSCAGAGIVTAPA